jgi:hypothetical protein
MLEGILGPAPTGSNLQLTDTPFRNVHLSLRYAMPAPRPAGLHPQDWWHVEAMRKPASPGAVRPGRSAQQLEPRRPRRQILVLRMLRLPHST